MKLTRSKTVHWLWLAGNFCTPIFGDGKKCTLLRDKRSHFVGTLATECCGMSLQKRITSTWFLLGNLIVPHRGICGVKTNWQCVFQAAWKEQQIHFPKGERKVFSTFYNWNFTPPSAFTGILWLTNGEFWATLALPLMIYWTPEFCMPWIALPIYDLVRPRWHKDVQMTRLVTGISIRVFMLHRKSTFPLW